MKTQFKLFFKWGIQFEDAYSISEKSERNVQYADSKKVGTVILEKFMSKYKIIEFKEIKDEEKMQIPKTRKRRDEKFILPYLNFPYPFHKLYRIKHRYPPHCAKRSKVFFPVLLMTAETFAYLSRPLYPIRSKAHRE